MDQECDKCKGTGIVKDLILFREAICECLKQILTNNKPVPPEYEATFQNSFPELLAD